MIGFDALMDEAWPASYSEDIGGWRLRYAEGVTKRANSVWPAAEPPDVEHALATTERFYATRGLPAVFSIGQGARPAGLDDLLAARAYEIVDPTLIMTGELPDDRPVGRAVDLAGSPSAGWLDLWWSVDGRYDSALDAARAILTGVTAIYASAVDGVGRAVPQGEWLGINCMAVNPRARRRGIATDVLNALVNEGRRLGARRCYLAVTEHNTAARTLYERLGFEAAARYHYRVRRRS